MKTLFNIFEAASEDSIWYKLGKHKFNWIDSESKKAIIDKYHISKERPREGIIRWMKDICPPFEPDKDEIIHRSKWDLKGVTGQSENQLMHPHYAKVGNYVNEHPTKKHDILTIFECSNKKPYNSDSVKKQWMKLFGDYTDFGAAAYGVVPYDYSIYYPYRYDEWNHYAETEYGAWAYREVSIVNFQAFMEKWGYKKVIVVMQNDHPQEFLSKIKEENIGGWGDKMELVTDKEFRKTLNRKYGRIFGNEGLLVTRTMLLPFTKVKYAAALKKCMSELNYSEEDIEKVGKIESIFNKYQESGKESSKKRKKALDELFKEYDEEEKDVD